MPRNGSNEPALKSSFCVSATMPRRLPQPSDDVTAYLVLNDHGQFGIAYVETDPAEAIAKRSSAIS